MRKTLSLIGVAALTLSLGLGGAALASGKHCGKAGEPKCHATTAPTGGATKPKGGSSGY